MSKINLLNLVLFVVVISLAFFIYFSEEPNYELERLTDTDLNGITKIKITHNKNTTEIIRQTDGEWKITKPVSVAANKFRISSILKLINAPVHNKYLLSEIDADTFGLTDPETSIQLGSKLVSFGITNPATGLRYVLIDDSVYTIEDVYYPLISSHFGTLVSLNLLPDDSTIEKLVLSNQTITKDENGLWQSTIDITADNIVKTIDHWKSTQAFGVHEYLSRDNLGRVDIYIADEQQAVTYIVTDTDPWLILARPELGLEYHLDIEAYDNLIVPR